jgi:hypothetical protein
VKAHLPFDTCAMDVLMTHESSNEAEWKAQIIEFNGFGTHPNTGSDLFRWVHDAHILHGENGDITVRFIENKKDEDQIKIQNIEVRKSDESSDETSDEISDITSDTSFSATSVGLACFGRKTARKAWGP